MRAIPHTRTGKKLEVPLKRLFQGTDPTEVIDSAAVDDPAALAEFVALAVRHRAAERTAERPA